MENTNMPVSDAQDAENGKIIAILSYITLIGWVIAYVMHSSNKTKFGAFHIRQGLGLMIMSVGVFILSFVMMFISFYLYSIFQIVNLGILAIAIMGIVNAAGGKKQGIPVLGEFFDKTFASIN
ncbi:MAG: hypothetical protein NT084_12480 [Bacteroidetes bacterium]|nr:hypothetical protein [Bacteroidota bacterium]